MPIVILRLAICALVLAACTPRPEVVEAGVRSTLTALAPTALLAADRATSTPVPTLPPATRAPTATPAGTDIGASEAVLVATLTGDPAPAPGHTPSAPTVGELIFEDTFDAAGPWAVGETDDSNVSVSGGVMLFTQKTPGLFSFRLIGKQAENFHVEVNTGLVDRCASGDRYGLMFRVQDPSNYYAFVIDCDGQYRFLRCVTGAATPILDWTVTPSIERGARSVNRLAVTAVGDAFEFSINGTPVASASDGIFAQGRFGLLVGANVTKDFAVVFDNLMVNDAR